MASSALASLLGAVSRLGALLPDREALPPEHHRPWPVPKEPWVMAQRWEGLLFAHWPIARERLERLLPAALTLDTFEGQAWLGITPFRITKLRLRGLPAVPGASAFPEINVRTYVTAGGKPGVYFFSLDAANPLAVTAARHWYRLPYFHAAFAVEARDGAVAYASRRRHASAPPAEFAAEYRARGAVSPAPVGSLAWWLTERYCLYASDTAALYRAEIHHAPWPLQSAMVTVRRNTMAAPLGLTLPDAPVLVHFAARLDVNVWPPHRITG
jgi:uncharacterized protein YqjF (DUF2071 family)